MPNERLVGSGAPTEALPQFEIARKRSAGSHPVKVDPRVQ